MNDPHETNYDDFEPPQANYKTARAKARNETYRRIYGGHSADYVPPEPTTWQDIVMRVLIGVAAVALLLLIGGTDG